MDQEQQSPWRPTRRQLLWAGGIVAVLAFAVLIGYRYGITLWDWLKLLVVPAVIAGGGIWFNAQQRAREQRIANEHAQDEALQSYIDQVSQLLTNEKSPLRETRPVDSLNAVARARTLTTLPRLNGSRKGLLLRFLYEADLLTKGEHVLSLHSADLSNIELSRADLGYIFLHSADLHSAALSRATLRSADLSDTNLEGADLNDAQLENADLNRSMLSNSNLEKATLFGVDLRRAYLVGANLRGALLQNAQMNFANMRNTDLSGANFEYASLYWADLSGANLKDVREVTGKQLAEARSLEGATMPDGQTLEGYDNPDGPTFEEWLTKYREEYGKDSNPS